MMRQGRWFTAIVLVAVGCVTDSQERLHTYNEDGIYLFQNADYAGARNCFQAALALRPDDPDLLYNLGECADCQGNLARAERLYGDCLQHAPNHAACRHALAALQVRTGRQAEAASMVKDWLTRQPESAAACAEEGWLSRESGDLPRAQLCFQRALERDPHDRRALLEMALLYEALQRPDRAVVLYERLLELEPDRPDVIKRHAALIAQGAQRPRPE